MTKEIVDVPGLSASTRARGIPLSQAVKANGFVFVSGMPPMDVETGAIIRGDIETQTRAALKALEHILKAAGSSLDKVVMVRVYAANAGFYGAINKVYAETFKENPPARTFVPVASWPMEFDLEIECQALA